MLKISIINKTNDKKIENIFTKKLQKNIDTYDNPKNIVLKSVNDTMHHWKYMKKLGKSIRVTREHGLNLSCLYCNELFKENQLVRKTACNHYFHKKCIDSWILKNNQSICPHCNLNI